MNDLQLAKAIKAARIKVHNTRVGPFHSMWDVIFDAEELLVGGKTIVTRVDIERHLQQFLQD